MSHSSSDEVTLLLAKRVRMEWKVHEPASTRVAIVLHSFMTVARQSRGC